MHTESLPLGRSVLRTWQRNPPLAPFYYYASANPFVSSESTTIGTRGGQAKTTTRQFSVDRNGNTTLLTESDWISGQLRKTQSLPLYATTNATGTAPTVDETNAYWQQGARRNIRAVKRQRVIQDVPNSPPTPPTAVTRSLKEFSYDANWNPTQVRSWDSTKAGTAPSESAGDILNTANAIIQQSGYSPTGNPTSQLDPNTNATTYAYDAIPLCSPTQPTVSDLYATSRLEAPGSPI